MVSFLFLVRSCFHLVQVLSKLSFILSWLQTSGSLCYKRRKQRQIWLVWKGFKACLIFTNCPSLIICVSSFFNIITDSIGQRTNHLQRLAIPLLTHRAEFITKIWYDIQEKTKDENAMVDADLAALVTEEKVREILLETTTAARAHIAQVCLPWEPLV